MPRGGQFSRAVDINTDFEIEDLDLDAPRDHEVLIRMVAAGCCHSDELLKTGDIMPRFPIVGGHEGAGIIEEVGPGVTRVQPGDHVVTSWIPSCGYCRFCATGQQNLCDDGATILEGRMPDGTFRFHGRGQDVGAYTMLGSFSEYSVISERSCIPIDRSVPLDVAVLTSCGFPTGWGSAVYVADVEPGDTVVVYGIGGLGSAAVIGAVYAGALHVVAVDPLENKRAAAKSFGATHTAAGAQEAQAIVQEITNGVGADKSIVTVGLVEAEHSSAAIDIVHKGGTAVITGMNGADKMSLTYASQLITLNQKTIKGTLYGNCNPNREVPKLIGLYQAGKLDLDALVTTRYPLEQVNQAYTDLDAGKNLRGVLTMNG